jgi:hypothetical protein
MIHYLSALPHQSPPLSTDFIFAENEIKLSFIYLNYNRCLPIYHNRQNCDTCMILLCIARPTNCLQITKYGGRANITKAKVQYEIVTPPPHPPLMVWGAGGGFEYPPPCAGIATILIPPPPPVVVTLLYSGGPVLSSSCIL